jgi:hypothetical protein
MDAYLQKRSDELMLDRMPRNEDIMNEIFEFDVRNLEATSSIKLSQFIIGLSQFLIYFGSQINKTQVDLMQKKSLLERHIERAEMTGRNRDIRRRKSIDAAPELLQLESGVELLEQELALVANREQYLMELINAFKKELSRRDTEERLSKNDRRY